MRKLLFLLCLAFTVPAYAWNDGGWFPNTDENVKHIGGGDNVGLFNVGTSPGQGLLTVVSSGKVGIGTTAPTAKLVILAPLGTASTGTLYLKPSGTSAANRIGLVLENESGVCFQLVVIGVAGTVTPQAIACP